MSHKIPQDARLNGLETEIDPLAESDVHLDASDVERRMREESEQILRHDWEHGPGKDDRDPLGASHL